MDYIMAVTVIVLIVGLCVMVYSFFMKDEPIQTATSNDADKAMEELNNLSRDVFNEFDEKYKELLFLYEMLDSKKNDSRKEVREAAKKAETKLSAFVNPKLKDILELKGKGMTVNQIAKTLNMGQGEVQLIMNLGRNR